MGFNATVVVLLDALHEIDKDPEFGHKLASAISKKSIRKGIIDVSALNHVNAASVIETHHADRLVPVLVGGNIGAVVEGVSISYRDGDTELRDIVLLRALAAKLGYRISKILAKVRK
jgi:hypothetical protein